MNKLISFIFVAALIFMVGCSKESPVSSIQDDGSESTYLAKRRPPSQLSVKITSPTSGAQLQPGAFITVQASSNVKRVEYSIVSTSYVGLTENYLGSSTSAPFTFTWNGYASAIVSGGYSPYRLLARAYDSSNNMVTNEINVVVTGTFNGPNPPNAKNIAAASASSATLGGAQLVSHSQGSAVRQLVEFNSAGDYADFELNAAISGNYEITIVQFKLTGTKPSTQVKVNGQIVASSFNPVKTVTNVNDFGREGQTTVVASLNAGANTIRLTTANNNILSVGSIRIAQP